MKEIKWLHTQAGLIFINRRTEEVIFQVPAMSFLPPEEVDKMYPEALTDMPSPEPCYLRFRD